MDWKSNFSDEEQELVAGIVQFGCQIGYEPGSLQDIIKRMASILDNAEKLINSDGVARPVPDLTRPTPYQGPPQIKLG